jgi:hypothetical protein
MRVEDGKGIAWGNIFVSNGNYDLYNAGKEEFRAPANWWGVHPSEVGGRIYDIRVSKESGKVIYHPVLNQRPFAGI